MSDLLCDNSDRLHKWLSKIVRLDLSYSSLLSLIFSHFFLSFFFIQFNSHQSCLSSLILFSLISHFFDFSYLSFLSSLIFSISHLFSLFFVILWRTFIWDYIRFEMIRDIRWYDWFLDIELRWAYCYFHIRVSHNCR